MSKYISKLAQPFNFRPKWLTSTASGAFFILSSLAIIMHWPLIIRLNTHVIGRPFEDVFEFLWLFSWAKTAVFELHVNPFYTPYIFHPEGFYLAGGANPIWYAILFAPLTYLFGEVATYNFIQLVVLICGGFGVYLLARLYTKKQWPSLLAGCIYMVAPINTLRLAGHLNNLIGATFLAFMLWAMHCALLKQKRFNWLILTAIFLSLSILGHWYFLLISTLTLIAFVFFSPQINWRLKLNVLVYVIGLTVFLIAPWAWLTQSARTQMFAKVDFSIQAGDASSLSVDRLVVPNPLHAVWGSYVVEQFQIQGEEDYVALGFVAIALALIGIYHNREKVKPLIWVMVGMLILALGTTLHWRGERVIVSPIPLLDKLNSWLLSDLGLPFDQLAIPLPTAIFYKYLPIFHSMRVWSRFLYPFTIIFTILSAFGLKTLIEHVSTRWNLALISIVFICVIVEGWITPYRNFTPVSTNVRPMVTKWIDQQNEDIVLIEYPLPYTSKIAMYSQSLHNQFVVNGQTSILPTHFQQAQLSLGTWPQAQALPIFREWGVDYVFVSGNDGNVFKNEILPSLLLLDGLCLYETFNEGFMLFTKTYVFAVLPPATVCESEKSRE